MKITTQIEYLQPPEKLADGFLSFAKEVNQKCIERGVKFTIEEITDLFNHSLPGKIRANFLIWIIDVNRVIEAINLIQSDLSELRNDKNSLKGNPVIRSEFLFQAFFGEFFRIRELSKSFIKYLYSEKILNKKEKATFIDFYFQGFDWVYELRNSFVHQGMSFKNYDIQLNLSTFKDLSTKEKEKFEALLKQANTRENTVEIQCALYMNFIFEIMGSYNEFQNLVNNVLADLIFSFEELNLHIEFTENDN